jgi:Zn-finger nucleic acid-binding protein
MVPGLPHPAAVRPPVTADETLPHCHEDLRLVTAAGVDSTLPKCGGLWFDASELGAVVTPRALKELSPAPGQAGQVQGVQRPPGARRGVPQVPRAVARLSRVRPRAAVRRRGARRRAGRLPAVRGHLADGASFRRSRAGRERRGEIQRRADEAPADPTRPWARSAPSRAAATASFDASTPSRPTGESTAARGPHGASPVVAVLTPEREIACAPATITGTAITPGTSAATAASGSWRSSGTLLAGSGNRGFPRRDLPAGTHPSFPP